MTLTLRSSTSFINLKDTKTLKTPDEFSTVICSAKIKPSCRLRAKSSMQEAQLSRDKQLTKQGLGRSEIKEKLHELSVAHQNGNESSVPVFVMLPLDTVTQGGHLNKPRAMNASLMALKSVGVEGVMVDAWWGLVEKDGPLKYNWEGYAELIQMVQKHGLKLQVVMSFHQCGGNVGDSCSIPLPPWVLEEISKDPDLVYTDRSGRRNPEYISLGCDTIPVLKGRTPIQVYSDFMRSFRDTFRDYLGRAVVEIQVGMGPCGELRYPSYPESNGTWRFPGIGEFQCYDKVTCELHWQHQQRRLIKRTGEEVGRTILGSTINFLKIQAFFGEMVPGTPSMDKFFLEWYSENLLKHGDRILAAAKGIFQGTGANLSGKVAGIHWHHKTRSHAAESTAGYYNTRHRDGYLPIARMFSKHGVILNFTCMEMRDREQPDHANCSPEGLVRQVKMATKTAGTELAGENALERYDASAYAQVMTTSRSDSGNGLSAFTYLRMNKKLFEGDNWRNLVEFVKSMSDGGRRTRLPECDSIGSNLYVGFVKEKKEKKIKEAALV
ncbi:hypothetical protein Patl1_18328 [Pistacia atlantica]|uniref:Uncharacterized protein n=1 Tax=Pistacia atlantica TaxID=434234 RepID=A0ACC1C3J9_9ROSI|nr:hypothetical protein Patl1_18328 [Pistacia atlantica]